jgi:hypothetical protein
LCGKTFRGNYYSCGNHNIYSVDTKPVLQQFPEENVEKQIFLNLVTVIDSVYFGLSSSKIESSHFNYCVSENAWFNKSKT